ncbi:MAG: protein phosphatase 2C domain-containing protein [Desulfovibrio sp.]|uniref:PP2C family protein-serine/threonine phosphatase n=1 Tax=Desulfovibrio sp. TaxID=885 RepID=UPI0039E316FF
MISFSLHAASHKGNIRKVNEDRVLTVHCANGPLLLAVADGMGGVDGGDIAASIAVKELELAASHELDIFTLEQAAIKAHEKIYQHAATHTALDGMGTTLTAALLHQGDLYWVHVGDSRLYRLRAQKLEQLTTDHRFLTSMIQAGDITVEQARKHPLKNVLEQCLGGRDLQLEQGRTDLIAGDKLLLCTDGLHDEVSLDTMKHLLTIDTEPENLTGSLLQTALDGGGNDNISLIVAVCETSQHSLHLSSQTNH